MGRGGPDTSPLEVAAREAGTPAIEAFSILGNETRLSILLALWEAYEPFAETNSLRFSELRSRVGLRHGSQFNYHLDRLVGLFVTKTDEGYELTNIGLRIVQTVIAGTGLEDRSIEPTEIAFDCNLCGASTVVVYEDQMLYAVCTECDGFWGHRDDFPDGAHNAQWFEPAGLTDRTPEEVYKAARCKTPVLNGPLRGVCDLCSGPMTASLDICEDHASDGLCRTCDLVPRATVRFRCSVCKRIHHLMPVNLVQLHPAGIAFFWDQGIPLVSEGDVQDLPGYPEHDLSREVETTVLSLEPPRVRVTIRLEDAELQADVNENLYIREVETRERPRSESGTARGW